MMSRLILEKPVVGDNLSWEKSPMETSLGFHKFKNKERVWGELFSNFFIKINAGRERGRKRGNKSIRIMKKKIGLDNQIKCIYFFFSLLFYFFSFFFYWLFFSIFLYLYFSYPHDFPRRWLYYFPLMFSPKRMKMILDNQKNNLIDKKVFVN